MFERPTQWSKLEVDIAKPASDAPPTVIAPRWGENASLSDSPTP